MARKTPRELEIEQALDGDFNLARLTDAYMIWCLRNRLTGESIPEQKKRADLTDAQRTELAAHEAVFAERHALCDELSGLIEARKPSRRAA